MLHTRIHIFCESANRLRQALPSMQAILHGLARTPNRIGVSTLNLGRSKMSSTGFIWQANVFGHLSPGGVNILGEGNPQYGHGMRHALILFERAIPVISYLFALLL